MGSKHNGFFPSRNSSKEDTQEEEMAMRQRLGLVGFVSVVCLVVLFAAPLRAQEWSAAQKDVWKSVEAYWAFDLTADIEGFMSYVDPSYVGWSYESPVPEDKATVKKFMSLEYQLNKTLVYDIKPVAIQVHGNFAFADYYYMQLVKNAEGKTEEHKGRWTDILMKQGDRWVLIGDHGGEIKSK
jgi:ketosteroid isomerase-like protein